MPDVLISDHLKSENMLVVFDYDGTSLFIFC